MLERLVGQQLLSLGSWLSPQSHSGAENLWASWRAAGFHFMSEGQKKKLGSDVTNNSGNSGGGSITQVDALLSESKGK